MYKKNKYKLIIILFLIILITILILFLNNESFTDFDNLTETRTKKINDIVSTYNIDKIDNNDLLETKKIIDEQIQNNETITVNDELNTKIKNLNNTDKQNLCDTYCQDNNNNTELCNKLSCNKYNKLIEKRETQIKDIATLYTLNEAELDEFNKLKGIIEEERVKNNNFELTEELEDRIKSLSSNEKDLLCNDYCQLYGGCSNLCKFLGCYNCSDKDKKTTLTTKKYSIQTDQNVVPRTVENTHVNLKHPGDINLDLNNATNNDMPEVNIYAPYVVVQDTDNMDDKYMSFVSENPYDPNYYKYISKLI